MSRKSNLDSFISKPSRNDRFAQMSRQEQVIEQKKREIQARLLQQKEKAAPVSTTSSKPAASVEPKKAAKPLWKGNLGSKPNQNANNKLTSQFNMFSNDGSFLDQFKQLNDTKKSFDQKITISSIKSDKVRDNQDRNYSDERVKPSRWSKSRQSLPFPSENPLPQLKPKLSRFSEPPPGPEPQKPPPIVTTFAPNPTVNFTSNELFANNFTMQPPLVQTTATVLQAPPPVIQAQLVTTAQMLVPPPIAMAVVPPPQIQTSQQILQQPTTGALIAPPPPSLPNPPLGGGISVPPPVISVRAPSISLSELTSIPAPTPIPVHSIPAPEPLNALTIPPPAPLQLQNIPSPSPIRLNEIPNPKPIDLMNIPEPGEEPPEFIKNVPPPNKSVPPPNLSAVPVSAVPDLPNITIPPPAAPSLPAVATVLPPPQTSVPPPMHTHPPPPQAMPPNAPNIPALMAQPVLPPPGMQRAVAPPPAPTQVAQPMVTIISAVQSLPGPPPVLNQPPPLATPNQMPPMTFPPPLGPPPNVHVNINAPPPGIDINAVCPPGSASHDAMVSLGRMVAQCGSGIEDIVQQRSAQDPSLWFLFHKHSAAYQQYRQLVEQFRAELGPGSLKKDKEYQPEDIYEPDNLTDDEQRDNRLQDCMSEQDDQSEPRKRKRKSRWGEKIDLMPPCTVQLGTIQPGTIQPVTIQPKRIKSSSTAPLLSKITRNDPGLIQYAMNTFGSANLSEEDWCKAEDHYKINLLYQEMLRKREEIEKLKRAGHNKYEYDSDEETDGGTWEHKLRMQEMEATQLWANELTRQAEGKHHIGDFLPPDELKNFMEKYTATKEGRQPNLSDYKEFKLNEDNIGFKMLQKLGWQEGQGLGTEGTGIVEPINKATLRDHNQGLGIQQPDEIANNDDEYDAYRKRMMLAYRFRPNPLNNPRRPYY